MLKALLILIALCSTNFAFAQTPPFFKAGTGTSGNTIPLNQASQKTQLLYTPSDFSSIPNSGFITKIFFRNSAAGATGTYTDFKVSFLQNSLPSFPNNSYLTGFTTAHSVATETVTANATAGGWFEIPLNTPFLYDSTQTLVVEIQYTGKTDGISTTTSSSTGNKRISGQNLTATTGTTNTIWNDFGIEVIPSTPCATPPTAGTATSTVTTICANSNFTLNLTGNSLGSGQTYQWETSPNGTTGWTSISAASITTSFVTNQTAGTHYYRAAVTCSGQTAYSTPVSVTSPALISGTFTINNNAPASATNFQSINAAISHLECGINGPVTFNIVAGSGPYNEQVIIPAITGASATNRVTINGNGATVSNDASSAGANRPTFRLDGANFITLDSLNIVAANATYGWGIHLMNGADNNEITNNTITIASTSTTAANSAGIVAGNSLVTPTTDGVNANNTLISNNTITGGYYGIVMSGNGSATATNNQLLNNTLTDFYYYGIYLDDQETATVSGNNISRPTRAGVGIMYGIYLSGTNSQNNLFEKNRIHNSHGANAGSTSTIYGIYFTGADAAAAQPNRVINNLIYNLNGSGAIYGIYNTSSDNARYYHNTISIDDVTSTSSNLARGFYQTTSASGIEFSNNIISITRGGTGVRTALYFNTAASSITSDRNVLWVNSNGGTDQFGSIGSAGYLTLADWRLASGNDNNSVSADPEFENIAAGNFKPSSFDANNIGAPVTPAVTTDITGAPRSTTTPDPGAYEFTLPPVDLGATALAAPVAKTCFTNAEQVSVVIRNLGSAPLDFTADTVTVTVNVTGAVTQTLSVALNNNTLNGGQPLAVGATLTVPVGTLDMTAPGNYTFNATTATSADTKVNNNAMAATVIRSRPISAGTAIAYSSLCAGDSTWLYLQDFNGTIQWQRFDGTNWVNETAPDADSALFMVKPAQNVQYRAIVSGGTCPSDTSNVISISVDTPQLTATAGDTLCGAGTATLTAAASAGDMVRWFSAATGGSAIATADTLSQPVTSTTTFYAEAARFQTAGNVGPANNNIGAGGYGNFSNQTVFDVHQPMRLDYVTLYSDGPVSFKVFLRDTVDGKFLDSAFVSLPGAGEHRVPLGFVIQPGSNYAIGIPNYTGSGQLFRSTAGTAFPYTLPNVVDITGTNFSPTTARYYYFYNWSVSTLSCASARQAVTAVMNEVNLGNDTTICSNSSITLDAGNTGATYLWNTGATTQTISADTAGTYWVQVTTPANCVLTDTIVVSATPAPAASFTFAASGRTVTFTNTGSTGTGFSYSWNFGDTNTSSTENPTHTYTTDGSYTVELTVSDSCGSVTATQTVTITTVGLRDEVNSNISVYPNPTAGKFTIAAEGFDKEVAFTILNVTGQVVYKGSLSGNTKAEVDLTSLSNGIYMIRIESADKVQYRKVVLEK